MIPIRLWAAIFCLLLVFPAITLAQLSPPTSQPSDEDAFVIGDRPPTQVPAGLGGAGANQDNNTGRGYGDGNLQLALLTPVQTGRTLNPQPTLFWHLSDATSLPVIITLSEEGNPKPLKTWSMSGEQPAGFHRIDLANDRVTLRQGIVYECVVALVPDPRRRSKDVVAIGFIELVPDEKGLAAQLSKSRRIERVAPLASAGLFYDSVAEAMMAIEANPTNPAAQAYRTDLLAAMKLTEASSSDVRAH